MSEPRLATGFWVQAYLARLSMQAIPAYITYRGDDTAGAVLIKLATMDGQAQLWGRETDYMTGKRHWRILSEGEEREIDAKATRQREFDPDLWVIEVEDRQGRVLIDEDETLA